MKATFLIASIALNAVLAFMLLRPPTGPTTPTSESKRTRIVTSVVTQEVAAATVTNIVQDADDLSFHWSSIQSTNFSEYAQQLVAIGCPPQTIRDIIRGEINDWMLQERHKLFAPYAPRFWQMAAEGQMQIPDDLKAEVKKLEQTRTQMLTNALAGLPRASEEDQPNRQRPYDATLTMLPPEKIERVKELDQKYSQLRKQVKEDATLNEKQKNEKYRELQKQLDAEKVALMSPEELAEYKRRHYSNQFPNVYGFKVSPEEMQQMADVFAQYPLSSKDPQNSETPEQAEARTRERQEALKALLGEQRLAEYERGQKHTYRMAWHLAKAHGLPEESANKVYLIQQEAAERAKAIRADKTLSKERQSELVDELQDSFEDAAAEIIGAKAAASYRRMTRNQLN